MILLVVFLPAAALWYWGILVSGRLRLGSSLRISRLSFRLLLFDVFADLHFVFLLGILVGNFIFNFLLFSYRNRDGGYEAAMLKNSSTSVVQYYLGSRAGTSKQSGASPGLNIWRTRHTGTEDLRGATERQAGYQTGRMWTMVPRGPADLPAVLVMHLSAGDVDHASDSKDH